MEVMRLQPGYTKYIFLFILLLLTLVPIPSILTADALCKPCSVSDEVCPRCPQKGDIVLFQPDPELNPVVKIIKGLPGDSLSLRGDGKNWNIIINEEILRTSTGDAYQVNDQAFQMLSLYIRDYHTKTEPLKYMMFSDIDWNDDEKYAKNKLLKVLENWKLDTEKSL